MKKSIETQMNTDEHRKVKSIEGFVPEPASYGQLPVVLLFLCSSVFICVLKPFSRITR